jgi:hypothetical protein
MGSVLGSAEGRRGVPRQAGTGARMKEAREKITNRISKRIVNCQRRRSTPRRLR